MSSKKDRPACPLCISRFCSSCRFQESGDRRWFERNHPRGECRRCGIGAGSVRVRPIRHTNAVAREEHVIEFLRKPVRKLRRDPDSIFPVLDLIDALSQPETVAYYRQQTMRDTPSDSETYAIAWNEGTAALIEIGRIVREWVAANPAPDGKENG